MTYIIVVYCTRSGWTYELNTKFKICEMYLYTKNKKQINWNKIIYCVKYYKSINMIYEELKIFKLYSCTPVYNYTPGVIFWEFLKMNNRRHLKFFQRFLSLFELFEKCISLMLKWTILGPHMMVYSGDARLTHFSWRLYCKCL